jgi:Arc/MetJ-type ribon-helix-helix transcriptional regulator
VGSTYRHASPVRAAVARDVRWAFGGAPTSGNRRSLTLVARCITFRHTDPMAKAISVRLDDEAERALRLLESTGLSRSEAIRSSLLASADRMRRRSQLAAEVAALEADDEDRNEMVAVASLMESMRAAG